MNRLCNWPDHAATNRPNVNEERVRLPSGINPSAAAAVSSSNRLPITARNKAYLGHHRRRRIARSLGAGTKVSRMSRRVHRAMDGPRADVHGRKLSSLVDVVGVRGVGWLFGYLIRLSGGGFAVEKLDSDLSKLDSAVQPRVDARNGHLPWDTTSRANSTPTALCPEVRRVPNRATQSRWD